MEADFPKALRELEDLRKEQANLKDWYDSQCKIYLTAHYDEQGRIDCVCSGTLCVVDGLVSEEDLGCRRLKTLLLEDVTETEPATEREKRGDYPGGMYRREDER